MFSLQQHVCCRSSIVSARVSGPSPQSHSTEWGGQEKGSSSCTYVLVHKGRRIPAQGQGGGWVMHVATACGARPVVFSRLISIGSVARDRRILKSELWKIVCNNISYKSDQILSGT